MNKVTIRAINRVMERMRKKTYKQGREALQKTDGNVV